MCVGGIPKYDPDSHPFSPESIEKRKAAIAQSEKAIEASGVKSDIDAAAYATPLLKDYSPEQYEKGIADYNDWIKSREYLKQPLTASPAFQQSYATMQTAGNVSAGVPSMKRQRAVFGGTDNSTGVISAKNSSAGGLKAGVATSNLGLSYAALSGKKRLLSGVR